MSFSGRGLFGWPQVAALLVLVFLTGAGAVALAPDEQLIASWWPAAGLAVALLVLAPRDRWWQLATAVAVVTALANVTGGLPVALSICFGVADGLAAYAGATALCWGQTHPPRLRALDDFLRLAVAAAIGAAVIATLAAVAVHLLDEGSLIPTWRSAFASNAASTLVITPVALTATRVRMTHQRWEAAIQAIALATATLLVFSPDQTRSLTFAPLPFLVWGALRLDLRIVTWELLGFSVAVTFLVARGYGPYGADYQLGVLDADGVGALVQTYLMAAALLSLPLAISVHQSRHLLREVSDRERLFRRVFTESPLGMVLASGSHLEIVDLNETAARMLGSSGSPLGREVGDVLTTAEPLGTITRQLLDGELPAWRGQTGLVARPAARASMALALVTSTPEPVFAIQLLDTTTELDARRRLEAAEKLTSATLDTTAAVIIVSDLYGEVVRVNNAALTLTGFTEDQLVGRDVWDLPIAPPGSTGYPAGLPDDVFSQVSRETDLLTSTGERLRVLWNTTYVRDDQDRPTYLVTTGTDLTAERVAAGLNRHLLEAAITTALIGIDPRGRITVFNAGAVNLLGYDAQDTVGTPFVDLLDQEQLARRCPAATPEEAFALLVADGGATRAKDWTWIGRDGRARTVSMTVSVAADTVAARMGYLCVGRDVTEARASQELLVAALDKERMAVERLRQLDAAKNEFVSTVSHELRTPVASIVGYTEMLRDGTVTEPTPDQARLLGSIERSGKRLIALCEDLLALGGLDSGGAHWDRSTIDLTELVGAAADAIKPLVSSRDLAVGFSMPPDPVLVLGDRAQLDRVIINLLGNAVKFTEDGGRVDCRLEQRDGEAWLVVDDTGIGIPEDEQSGLFQRFFRSSTAQRRAIQGTGLGLSIVAATVAAHGGRIDVRSAHLEGTTVTVRLPVTRSAATPAVRPGSPR